MILVWHSLKSSQTGTSTGVTQGQQVQNCFYLDVLFIHLLFKLDFLWMRLTDISTFQINGVQVRERNGGKDTVGAESRGAGQRLLYSRCHSFSRDILTSAGGYERWREAWKKRVEKQIR